MAHDDGAEILKAGPFSSLLVQLSGLAFWRAKSEEEDDKDQIYAFTIDAEVLNSDGTINGSARAFALYHPATNHDWISRRYAQERLHVFDYPQISKKGDPDTRRAIGKLELRWTCKGLSPFKQKSKFYVAPHADFDILFGHRSGSSQRVRRRINTNGALGTRDRHKVASRGVSIETLDGLRAPDGSLAGNASFEKGIRDGILVPVDDEVINEEEALLRPSLADLEKILHATPYETDIPSRNTILHTQENMNQVVTRDSEVCSEAGFPNKTSPLDRSYTDGRKEFDLSSQTESSWSSDAPHPTPKSREARPLNTSECIPSQTLLAPNPVHRYPKRELEESNEYTLDSAPQSLGQRPGCHTFGSEDEDLRLRTENIPRAGVQPKIEGEELDSSIIFYNPTSSDDICHIRSSSGNFPNSCFHTSRSPFRGRNEHMNSKTVSLGTTNASTKSGASRSKEYGALP